MKAERRSGALSLERAGNDRAYVDWFELAANSVVVAPVLAWRSGVRAISVFDGEIIEDPLVVHSLNCAAYKSDTPPSATQLTEAATPGIPQ